jgi:hypothetical protein
MDSRPEVPEDVRAELDLQERRGGVIKGVPAAVPELVPEDVRSEQYREDRLGNEDLQLRLQEGTPPADDDADAEARRA